MNAIHNIYKWKLTVHSSFGLGKKHTQLLHTIITVVLVIQLSICCFVTRLAFVSWMGQWTWTHFDVLLILIPTIVIFSQFFAMQTHQNRCHADCMHKNSHQNIEIFIWVCLLFGTRARARIYHTQRTPKCLKWNFPRNQHCRCLSGNCANCYSVWKSVLRIRLRANDHLTERTLYDCSVSQNTVTKLNQRLNPVTEHSLTLCVYLISNTCTCTY